MEIKSVFILCNRVKRWGHDSPLYRILKQYTSELAQVNVTEIFPLRVISVTNSGDRRRYNSCKARRKDMYTDYLICNLHPHALCTPYATPLDLCNSILLIGKHEAIPTAGHTTYVTAPTQAISFPRCTVYTHTHIHYTYAASRRGPPNHNPLRVIIEQQPLK